MEKVMNLGIKQEWQDSEIEQWSDGLFGDFPDMSFYVSILFIYKLKKNINSFI